MLNDYIKIRLSQLRVGSQLRAPIYDGQPDRDQLLLAAGAQLTKGQLELLKRRGVSHVLVHSGELERITGRPLASSPISQLRTTSVQPISGFKTPFQGVVPQSWKQGPESLLCEVERPRELQRDLHVLHAFEQTFHDSLTTTQNVFAEFASDQKINSAVVTRVAEQQIDQIVQDLDLYVSLGVKPVTEGYPSKHSLQMSMLAVSIGTIMGLSRDELLELSTGCLLHDAGMMLVPQHILKLNGPLSTADRFEILKHPLYIANALSRRNDISHGAKATAYQIHERLNGSGYPRKRQHPQIHLFARIGGVADTYLAMISPRSGRSGLSPYEAVEKLLYATRIGLFDAAVVRALLHAVSLFPVGSVVTLSDGRSGRVSRSNRDQYDRPVVEILAPDVDTIAEIIDLGQEHSLRVIGAGEIIAV